MSRETQSFSSTSLFVAAHAHSSSPPVSFSLLSSHNPLPSAPSDFPRSKVIPGTRFVIDAFHLSGDFSVSYFLSHFHSDHYAGLSPAWSRGIVFCSDITARLIEQVLGVSPRFVVRLPLNQVVSVDGCETTLIDSNHCPGAVQFLFKIPAGDGKSASQEFTQWGYMMRTNLPALAQVEALKSVTASYTEGTVENFKEKLQDMLVPFLMSKGIEFSSNTLAMVPGIPIRPMLAKWMQLIGRKDPWRFFSFICYHKGITNYASCHAKMWDLDLLSSIYFLVEFL